MSSSCPFSPRISSERGDGCGGRGYLREVREWEEECGRGPPSQAPLPHSTPRGVSPSFPPCSNLSWLSYGALKGDGTLIIVNTVGAVLQTLYILVYLHYCPRKVEAFLLDPPFCYTPCLAGRANSAS